MKQKELPSWAATADDFYDYWFADMGREQEASINALLSRSWARIQIALDSSGQGSCTISSAGEVFLKEQHLIISIIMLNIVGMRLEPKQRETYSKMFTETMGSLARLEIAVCSGQTSSIISASGVKVNYE